MRGRTSAEKVQTERRITRTVIGPRRSASQIDRILRLVLAIARGRRFPCPVCTEPRDIRLAKNGKPYLICDPCGIQLFVRGRVGVERFAALLERATSESVLARFNEIERRYRLTCPSCGHQFWIEPGLIRTSLFDGYLKGFRCPQPDCEYIVSWEVES